MLQPEVLRAAYDGGLNQLDEFAYYVKIIDNVARYKGKYVNGRVSSMLSLIRRVLDTYRDIPNCEFIVMVNDGTKPRVPVFGVARHWKSWTRMVPIPLLNSNVRKKDHKTGFSSWDAYVTDNIVAPRNGYPWKSKQPKAFFRGAFVMQTWALGSINNNGKGVTPLSWRDVNRGKLFTIAQTRPDLFNVGLTSRKDQRRSLSEDEYDSIPIVENDVSFRDWMRWKVLINVGSNQDWTERLRTLLFTNSLILRHEAEAEEWFYPMLRPYEHYVPFDIMMENLVEQAMWCLNEDNDEKAQEIVRNANTFATSHLTEDAMTKYMYILLRKYAALQRQSANGHDPFRVPDEDSDSEFKTIDDGPNTVASDRASIVSDLASEAARSTANSETKLKSDFDLGVD